MTSHIQKVLKQALITFSTNKPIHFITNLDNLSVVLDKTTAEDVNLDMSTLTREDGEGSPVTYIDIYEDSTLTMGIFVVQKDKKLPLHNHPEMYGLIKVLSGKIRVISYSLNTPKTVEVDMRSYRDTTSDPHTLILTHNKNIRKRVVTAEFVSNDVLGVDSKPCILDPTKRNIHEIHSVDGPAAFIDILAPPYNTEIPGVGPRYCAYYSILSNVLPNIYRLQEIRNPSWYWTDSVPYAGPNPAVNIKLENESV